MSFAPAISPDIFALRPDFTALSVHVEAVRNTESDARSVALLDAACGFLDAAPWAEAHLEAWRDAYRAFGAKPQRTPCSAEALRRRALKDGRLPTVNAVVDLYNAISLCFALPIGGEDADVYAGAPSLIRATGGEPFDTFQDGRPRTEPVDPGEVVWRDAQGVTCRRWNWRQGVRTRISADTTSMWFVLERLDPMPMDALAQAGAELVDGLKVLSPGARVSTLMLGVGTARGGN
ncbi:B3/4 domain-containing protein [Caulobacter sp. BK020]|uniref:B3/B4 domain-containing protein n=1 Tax=Caulobacter sp. BK020 TaxID=2512117 RepID=UPI001047988D|nr:B3/4 domain-containing protein [Caulobacter sp. BK020]TCS15035.1 DNA/RNA-binding domain of Phe-tRNA-synthetase-like protein [Caulobacter sp. BK020]